MFQSIVLVKFNSSVQQATLYHAVESVKIRETSAEAWADKSEIYYKKLVCFVYFRNPDKYSAEDDPYEGQNGHDGDEDNERTESEDEVPRLSSVRELANKFQQVQKIEEQKTTDAKKVIYC